MTELMVRKLREEPALSGRAARWFSSKWNIPVEAYEKSIRSCIEKKKGIPQWYVILDTDEQIAAGAGVIENDFHDRPDLSPNLCALFVEENCRKKGIARYILDFIREDMRKMGVKKLYLVTDHTDFYEKCGWEFLTMVRDDEGKPERLYEAVL